MKKSTIIVQVVNGKVTRWDQYGPCANNAPADNLRAVTKAIEAAIADEERPAAGPGKERP